MPWKNPEDWLYAEIMAPILSFFLSLLRAAYFGPEESWPRRLLEATICGLLTLTVAFGVDALGWNGDWKYALAGGIGFLGTDYVRNLAKRFLDKQVAK